ncbi:3-HAO-domain-containing protein [Piedraia hortae CBS 480.64]|uniref:3-hydroxyanthranilate 3,4-dioxygenase n=1 Tax=Piedraia hortae CBS 480.64 TaxID=1314780 RepID=A0A6A7BSW7_9PEZI|nr:3-HAO-domain-containing protein [Piedraia hortae CBS 480.64]
MNGQDEEWVGECMYNQVSLLIDYPPWPSAPSGAISLPVKNCTSQHDQIMYQFTRRTLPKLTKPRFQSTLTSPLNLPQWLKQNSHLLKPPINNAVIHREPLMVQIVGGPNARTDYHINSTPEFFFQWKGRMLLRTMQNSESKDYYINEGEFFLLPGNIPHCPVRFEDTVGVVLELPRPEGSMDRLRWYCPSCRGVVYETEFHCTDLGTQIKYAVEDFTRDEHKRTCQNCGTICSSKPDREAMERMNSGK